MPEWLKPYLRGDSPESSRRLVLWQSAAGILIVTLGQGIAITYRIASMGDIGTGAVAAFSVSLGALAGLAGLAHRQSTNEKDPS